MVDWTHSFIRNASTLPDKYEDIMGPYQTPNTTLLGFRRPPEQLTAWILDISEKPLRVITDTTPEGKALLDFLLPITKEPEYDYISWGQARELPDYLFVFIGKHHNVHFFTIRKTILISLQDGGNTRPQSSAHLNPGLSSSNHPP